MRQSSCRQNHTVHVTIIGCSVAGLTLAHALSKRRIDYTILEAHDRLPLPSTGNAFTLLPNGSRILLQLGVWEEIAAASDTIHSHSTFLGNGRLLERIDIFYNNLKDKHRVRFGKRVMTVDQSSSEAKVECADDSIFTGDLVVGADGIHSVSRGEILRWNGSLQAPQDLRKVAVMYIFWLLSFHAGKVHRYPDVPRHSQDRASIDQQVFPFLDAHISSNFRFEELYHNTIACCHVALEEMLCEQWVAGRLVCIGDSVHKMTPNLAQGANFAIESSASLANCIVRTVDQHKSCARPDNPEKDMDLAAWEESRKQRMRRFYTYSWILARCEAFSGSWFKALGLYIGFFHGEQVISYISDISSESECLDYLPQPDYHLKSQSKMDQGGLNQMNHLYIKLAFWLLDVLITTWSFCFV
ncbi:hypothetical protein BDV33DRAFT_190112 [Aspergillus novoparasiticus]|uniref:FAD-binding domain-containing protein n=1 Tax=Aspergillus novoparasiticus TaxID=986946 RepID=A0A5N6EW89_9EURO|nr:hypothetical protein BDV33DRAFT_190112 [Aspergillus novoparasiticus]